jgi:hypothetical protein
MDSGIFKVSGLDNLTNLMNDKAPSWVKKRLTIIDLGAQEIDDYSNKWDGLFIQSSSLKNKIRLFDDLIRNRTTFSLINCDSLILEKCTHEGDLKIVRCNVHKLLSLKNSVIVGTFEFDSDLPDSISFENLDLSALKGTIDLTRAKIINGTCNINLAGTDINKIKFNFKDFTLAFPDGYNDNNKENFYTNLVKKFKDEGVDENIELADVKFKQFKYKKDHAAILDFIDANWWYYGYKKSLIIRNSVLLYFIFFLINLTVYKFLLFEVYTIENFEDQYDDSKKNSKMRWRVRYAIDCLLYTAFIFWNLRIDLKELQTKHFGSVLYVLFQYLVGLVCVSYLANLILTK